MPSQISKPAIAYNFPSAGLPWTALNLGADDGNVSPVTIYPAGSVARAPAPLRCSSDGSSGGSPWINPRYAAVNGTSWASCSVPSGGDSAFLAMRDFVFGGNLPLTATVAGFHVSLTRRATSGGVHGLSLQLLDGAGLPHGEIRTLPGVWSNAAETVTLGGASDSWGVSVTPQQVTKPLAGVRLRCSGDTGGLAEVKNASLRVFYAANPTSQLLATGGHGFSVPSNATITGVGVRVERRGYSFNSPPDVRDDVVGLVSGSNLLPINHAQAAPWPGVFGQVVYGGEGDLWGGSLTPEVVNDDSFGAVLSCFTGASAGIHSGQVDFVELEVFYTLPE